MTQDPFAGRAADLIGRRPSATLEAAAPNVWCEAAEDCVLARLGSLRILGGLPRHKRPMSASVREDRLKALLTLWASGCTRAVDEELFADILGRARKVP